MIVPDGQRVLIALEVEPLANQSRSFCLSFKCHADVPI